MFQLINILRPTGGMLKLIGILVAIVTVFWFFFVGYIIFFGSYQRQGMIEQTYCYKKELVKDDKGNSFFLYTPGACNAA